MEDNAPDPKTPRWPYSSWKTVLNLIQNFEGDGGLPPRIDRSVLGGSEGQKTQTMAALRFLGMTRENGEVTQFFQDLVNKQKERPELIREALQRLYPVATKLGRDSATTKQLEESFTGLSGDTLRKAVTFYLHAAKYSGNPISKHFKIPSGFRTTGAGRKQRSANGTEAAGASNGQPTLSPTEAVSDPKARYINMLLDRASKDESLNAELLDRIEKLLGLVPQGAE